MVSWPTAKFRIMVRLTNGLVIEAFTWTRDAKSGIERARREAKEFGFNASLVWAETI